jgi:hypothetical protein
MKQLLPRGVEPRDEAFRLYWHFASGRQDSYYRRLCGATPPWTDDEILERYKFCNVFRVCDRVTQDMLRSAIYSDSTAEMSPVDRVFRTIVYRFFSEPSTWAYLDEAFGPLTASSYDEQRFNELVDHRIVLGQRVYTGAFILCATRAYGHSRKHHNHAALFASLLEDDAAPIRSILDARTLRDLYGVLRGLPLIGKFMAYQIAIDINYGPDVDFPESSFVAAGPGAERGLKKCFVSWGSESPESLIEFVMEHQEELAAHYGYSAPTLFGRRMQSIDCQGLFCETDKYCRVALPQLRSARSRIKATFQPRPTIGEFFPPPKWRLEATEPEKLVSPMLGGSRVTPSSARIG